MKYSVDELKEICLKHIKWINNDPEGEKANLSGADLSGADLSGAYLSGAYLSGADNAEYAQAQTYICPEGAVIGWKKALNPFGGYCIIKLSIPEESKRSNATGRKCRAEFADVLEVIGAEYAVSNYNASFEYKAGERVTAHVFEENRWNECAGGIHFFITRKEAEEYSL